MLHESWQLEGRASSPPACKCLWHCTAKLLAGILLTHVVLKGELCKYPCGSPVAERELGSGSIWCLLAVFTAQGCVGSVWQPGLVGCIVSWCLLAHTFGFWVCWPAVRSCILPWKMCWRRADCSKFTLYAYISCSDQHESLNSVTALCREPYPKTVSQSYREDTNWTCLTLEVPSAVWPYFADSVAGRFVLCSHFECGW